MRNVVTFSSTAFNSTEVKDYFINPGCFGDDLGRWLEGKLKEKGFETDGMVQEDFGWALFFKADNKQYVFVFGWMPESFDWRNNPSNAEGSWWGQVERRRGCLLPWTWVPLGIKPEAIRAIHDVLSRAAEIRNVRWHEDLDARDTPESGNLEP